MYACKTNRNIFSTIIVPLSYTINLRLKPLYDANNLFKQDCKPVKGPELKSFTSWKIYSITHETVRVAHIYDALNLCARTLWEIWTVIHTFSGFIQYWIFLDVFLYSLFSENYFTPTPCNVTLDFPEVATHANIQSICFWQVTSLHIGIIIKT